MVQHEDKTMRYYNNNKQMIEEQKKYEQQNIRRENHNSERIFYGITFCLIFRKLSTMIQQPILCLPTNKHGEIPQISVYLIINYHGGIHEQNAIFLSHPW